MPAATRIGYIGVDVLNNATVCNEATGLLNAGVPLEVVSVYRHEKATFYQGESIETLKRSIDNLFPMGIGRVLLCLLAAPFLFGFRFWSTAWKAVFGPAEGWRQRLTIIYQFVPSVVLAVRWRNRSIGHIHAHWAHTATSVAMHAAGLLGVGFSFTGHANDLFVHRIGLLAKVRRARFIVCISEYHRRFYLDMGADPRRLPIVYCGIDLNRFEPTGSEDANRRKIVSVGRLVEKKGFRDLITACAILRDRGVEFECTIAGSGPDYQELSQQIESEALQGLVTLTGKTVIQEELPELLRSAAVTALPCVRDRDGDMDGLPQVLIESLACGVPVVSTRLVGIPDLVRDGLNGLLVEPGDVPALADAIESLLNDAERAELYGKRGSHWAHNHFGRDETVARLAHLFDEAASTPGLEPLTYLPKAAPDCELEYPTASLLSTAS